MEIFLSSLPLVGCHPETREAEVNALTMEVAGLCEELARLKAKRHLSQVKEPADG